MWAGLASCVTVYFIAGRFCRWEILSQQQNILGNSGASDLISYAARIYCRCIKKVAIGEVV